MPLVIKPKVSPINRMINKKETIVVQKNSVRGMAAKPIQKIKKSKKVKTPKEEAELLRKTKVAARVYSILKRRFPKTFFEEPKPLAVGIKEPLFLMTEELGVSKTNIRIFLGFYIHSTLYKKQIVEGAERINLQGEVAGYVTKLEEDFLKKKLKKSV